MRYFFHLHESDGVTQDIEGQPSPDAASARLLAVQSARQLLSHKVAEGVLDLCGGIEVVDSATEERFFVAFREVIEIVD